MLRLREQGKTYTSDSSVAVVTTINFRQNFSYERIYANSIYCY